MPIGTSVRIGLAMAAGIAGLVALARWRELAPLGDYLAAALFAACAAYAMWQVRRFFDALERTGDGSDEG
ncbi:hypothetical protein [Caldovatus aquaticus]|uniref:Uncharacterized protein n=1 Tax=Caldovatus aquaticus TaxID=2865671 RepID=A0ABS7F6Q9_9PROT|nr:hypothetical protein [Caldovatus aquaticus]MBW8271308.1 hypothetical protein [Caldovatus aquaticus]